MWYKGFISTYGIFATQATHGYETFPNYAAQKHQSYAALLILLLQYQFFSVPPCIKNVFPINFTKVEIFMVTGSNYVGNRNKE